MREKNVLSHGWEGERVDPLLSTMNIFENDIYNSYKKLVWKVVESKFSLGRIRIKIMNFMILHNDKLRSD